ncbi:BREX-1 system phosphatase PglZ type A [Verrucomicrobia bacterium LW23]|nr:BREX-1 system phosphatase PglZ type A [Verrucomicrobia bacterium LW23]
MKRIHESLNQAFQRHRMVFWYDPAEEWRMAFDAFEGEKVDKLILRNNEFGLKVRLLTGEPSGRFLVYSPAARPADLENWLLDLLLQGHEFKADRASLALQEVGLPYEFRPLAEQHVEFFKEAKRVQALKEIVSKEDGPSELRLKMMGVLAGTTVNLDAILFEFLKRLVDDGIIDPVEVAFGRFALVEPFWKEAGRMFSYLSATPSLRDFAVMLFRGANPLDTSIPLSAHSKVFLQRWKDSQSHSRYYRQLAAKLEAEFQIASQLDNAGEKLDLGEEDTFEIFERFLIHRLCRAFEAGARADEILNRIQIRRHSFWFSDHVHGYGVIQQAVELRELIASAELSVDSIDTGVKRYRSSWWKIDRAYRKVCFHLRRYGQVNVMEKLSDWVGKAYVNNFLLPLADRWSDRVRDLEKWSCDSIPAQRRFFNIWVAPIRDKGQKVFVIVSDALRYEAAAEFVERINSENRFTAELHAVFASLPSHTQLGMASLLPGNDLSLDPNNGTATVDGRSATGTDNRNEILRRALDGCGTAIQAEKFLELNTKVEGRTLMRENNVIYIFHNLIDKVGDSTTTEAKTVDAVEQAFEELLQIVKKVANINANNMLLVSDHGFLFQQDPVAESDDTMFPVAKEWFFRSRRFAIGKEIDSSPRTKIFNASELNLPGEWACAFPTSLGRFPIQGSGKRFVHGGFSLQEVVVPVVHIHKARVDDTGRVNVEFMRVPNKITTGQVALSVFQEKPVTAKLLPRDLRVGVFAKDGTVISEIKTLKCDWPDEDARKRELSVVLVLSKISDTYNNKDVEIRLEETLPGTSQSVTYKSHTLKLQKPFTSDFDEF